MDEVAVNGEPKEKEQDFPSVDLAYTLAMSTYGLMETRLKAVEDRIQKLLTFAATLTFAAPVLVASISSGKTPNFASVWFILAMVLFGLTVAVGAYGLVSGTIVLYSPKEMFDSNLLGYPEWEFKKTAIYWAGEHFEANRAQVSNKAWYAVAMTAMIVTELGCLLWWAIQTAR